jgi:long-chain acyl-CoA synthetase
VSPAAALLLFIIVTSLFLDSSDVFTVSFFESQSGLIQGAQLTHENMTAGVSATRALLPLSHALSSLDTIVSAHPLSTPYGRAIAYTAIFEGTSFATMESSKLYHVEESE